MAVDLVSPDTVSNIWGFATASVVAICSLLGAIVAGWKYAKKPDAEREKIYAPKAYKFELDEDSREALMLLSDALKKVSDALDKSANVTERHGELVKRHADDITDHGRTIRHKGCD